MAPPPKPKLPPPAEPQHSRHFDPWNSVSTGHQRAEARGPQGWRESRNNKMNSQFGAGNSGGPRIADTAGPGSDDFAKDARARAVNSVADMLRNPGTMRAAAAAAAAAAASASWPSRPTRVGDARGDRATTAEERPAPDPKAEDEAREADQARVRGPQAPKIFSGLVVYANGSTHPLVSDHKLKHLLSEHGARMSLHLGRRRVTHVILGKPSGSPGGGAGGGLAGAKLQKEIRQVGGCGIKCVGVEWVLESIKAGKRLPEARFANLRIAARGQQSVLGAFSKADGSTQQPAAGAPGG